MWFDFQLVETYSRSSLSTNPPKGLCKADIEGGSIGVEFWWGGGLIFDQAPTMSLRGPALQALRGRRPGEREARV